MFRLFTTVVTMVPLAAGRGPSVNTFAQRSLATMARGGATSSTSGGSSTEYVTLSAPAPGSPFHYAFPVHNLEAAKEFYGNVLGCAEGRSSEKVRNEIGSAVKLLQAVDIDSYHSKNGPHRLSTRFCSNFSGKIIA
jgi:hypothetical protein